MRPGFGFYELQQLEQIAVNLFYGWGYNFYREENQLRADDLVIRAKVGWILGAARQSVATAEGEFRREFLPPPSREKPRHDATALAQAQSLERLARAIGALQGQMTSLPVPENDRMTQRYRQEAATLQRLIASDHKLVGQAELLRTLLDRKKAAWILENLADLEEGVAAISETLRARQGLLFPATS